MIKERLTTQLTPELCCSNIDMSLSFYTEILGFNIQYQRKNEGFAMLERQGARLMLDEINETKRLWITAALNQPFGRGINLEIKTTEIDDLYRRVESFKISPFLPMEEKWYEAGDRMIGHRQFIILDPDGYMLRFVEEIKQDND